jgi:anti-sigma factor RsiW
MSEIAATIKYSCSWHDISAYLDGELSEGRAREIELHFSQCSICLAELLEQKRLLCALDIAISSRPELELPKDFAKKIAVEAESGLNGLRHRRERRTAIILSLSLAATAALCLLVSGQTDEAWSAVKSFGGVITAFFGFLATATYDIAVGVVVVARAVGRLAFFNSEFSTFGLLLAFLTMLAALGFLLAKFRRVS